MEVGHGPGFGHPLSIKNTIIFSLFDTCSAKGELWYREAAINCCELCGSTNGSLFMEFWKIEFNKIICRSNHLSRWKPANPSPL